MGIQSLEEVKFMFMFEYTREANSAKGEYLSDYLGKKCNFVQW